MEATLSIYCHHETSIRPLLDLSKNNNQIHKSTNLPEFQKVEVVRQQDGHFRLDQKIFLDRVHSKSRSGDPFYKHYEKKLEVLQV